MRCCFPYPKAIRMPFRKPVLALTACLALTMPLMGCDSPQKKEAHYLERGNAFLNNDEPEKARVEYKNAARLMPTAAEPLYRLGMVDESEGDLRNAFGHFSAAEQQNDHYAPAVLKIAQYYMGAEQYDQSHKRVDAILAAEPNNAEALAMTAALLLREKNLDEAEKEARLALSKDPANISACSALTGIYSAKNDYDKATSAVNDGIAHNPKSLPLLMLRVVLFQHMNDVSKTAEAFQAIFKLKPKEIKYRVNLATLYVSANKLDEAEATLRQGVAALPDNWEMKHTLVLFLGEHRDMDTAEKEIRNLMQANPKNDEPYFWLADLYASHDATDKAVDLLSQIVERGQFDQPALNARTMLARLSIKRGNKELAEKLVTAVLSKTPDNQGALYIRANMAFENGYYQSAVSDLRSILRNSPKDQNALQLLGETFLLQGHLDLAIDTLQKLTELNPTNYAARVRLAQMVNKNGDHKQAMELITLVTQAAPQYPVGWETAARIAIDSKEWLLASSAIQTLAKIDGQQMTASYLDGQVQENNGNNDAAIAKYTEVINADPTAPLAEHALGSFIDLSRKLGRMEAATSYLETLKTDSPTISTMLGKCYVTTGNISNGAAAFDKAIANNATFQEPYIARAELYLKDHQSDQAIEILKKGATAAPNDSRAPLMDAGLLGDNGHYQDAIALYDDLLARNPALDIAANNLAEMTADYQSNDSVALEKARQTAERFAGSNNPLLLDTLAWVYFRQGNIQLAQTIMERALTLGTQLPPQMHYHYAAILVKSGKSGLAKAELQQALAGNEPYAGIEEAKKMLSEQ